jgi:hypothetical protein
MEMMLMIEADLDAGLQDSRSALGVDAALPFESR